MDLRPLRRADVAALEALVRAIQPVISVREVEIAMEVINDTLSLDPADPCAYSTLVADQQGRIVGFASYGQIPSAPGDYDLYWLVVHPEHQREGVGRALMSRVEAEVTARGGRQLRIDTSSRNDYAKARAFYLGMGYVEVGRVPDFYHPGDDKMEYAKALS